MKDVKRVGIIGTGVAGLVTAKTLIAQGVECVVFDKSDRLGGVWAYGYSNFGVQVPKELYEFPDWPMPAEAADFCSGEVFRQYLEDYVDHFLFRSSIRLNTDVVKVEQTSANPPNWRVTINTDAGTEQEDFDLIVVATGLYSNIPSIPTFPDQESFQGKILHSSDVTSRDVLANKNVVVVGYGKSAMDLVQEAVAVANNVHMLFRKPHWPVPRKLAGLLPTKFGALSRTTKAMMPLYMRPTATEQWLHRFAKPLKSFFWKSLELLIRYQYKLGKKIANGKDLIPSTSFEVDTCGEGTSMADPGFYPLVHEEHVSMHRTEISHFTPHGIALKDGSELSVNCVVFATGWKSEYPYLSPEVRKVLGNDDDGFYLYRHILHPQLPNLAFIGRVNAFSNIFTYSIQARWLAECVAGHVSLPTADEMLNEIEAMKKWKRSWMHFSSMRSSRIFLHAQHYHDELLTDFGANPFRKTGLFAPLKELFAPYMPADYSDIVVGKYKRAG